MPQVKGDSKTVSVVIVSDYNAGSDSAWEEIEKCIKAVASQTILPQPEIILVERKDMIKKIPDAIKNLGIKFLLLPCNSSSAFELRNHGVDNASGQYIAVLDSDCIPDSDWLKVGVSVLDKHKEAGVTGGRTSYEDVGLMSRVMGFLERAWLDSGKREGAQSVKRVGHNAAIWRKDLIVKIPFPPETGAFGADEHFEDILAAGYTLMFDPDMHVVHEYDGWKIEKELRRHRGRIAIESRRRDSRLRFSWLAEISVLAVPIILVGFVLRDWMLCIRLRSLYRLRWWYEFPVAIIMSVLVRALEIPGMIDALRRMPVPNSGYR